MKEKSVLRVCAVIVTQDRESCCTYGQTSAVIWFLYPVTSKAVHVSLLPDTSAAREIAGCVSVLEEQVVPPCLFSAERIPAWTPGMKLQRRSLMPVKPFPLKLQEIPNSYFNVCAGRMFPSDKPMTADSDGSDP